MTRSLRGGQDGEFLPGVLPGRAIRGQSMLSVDEGRPRKKMARTTTLYATLLGEQEASFLQNFDC